MRVSWMSMAIRGRKVSEGGSMTSMPETLNVMHSIDLDDVTYKLLVCR